MEIRCINRKLLKIIKKSPTSFLFSNLVPFCKNYYEKQKEYRPSYQSLFRLSNMSKHFRFKDLSPGLFWSLNSKRFLGYSENYNCQLMPVISWRYNYFTSTPSLNLKVAGVVNLKVVFRDCFYNLVVLIKLCKIRYLN